MIDPASISLAGIWRFLGIRGAIALGMAAALAFTMWRADHISGQRNAALEALGGEKVAHEATRVSLAELEKDLAAIVQDGRDREGRLAAARARAAREAKSMQRDLEKLRAASPTDPCKTPEVLFDVEI